MRVVPKGHPGNSPAFQRWVPGHTGARPEGTAERLLQILRFSRPFGTDSTDNRSPGVETPGYYQPSLRDDADGLLASRVCEFTKVISSKLAGCQNESARASLLFELLADTGTVKPKNPSLLFLEADELMAMFSSIIKNSQSGL